MDCLFCKIVRKEIPSHGVYEDDAAFGFLDIHPRSPGHAMVAPKIHAETVLDLPPEATGPLFLAVRAVTGKIASALKPSGFTIGINHGKVSGQTIDHLHIHVIPRFLGDGGTSLHGVVNNPPDGPLEDLAKKIRNG